MTHEQDGSVDALVWLPATPASARTARRFVRVTLSRWDLAHLVETVELLVSELVTNALVHATSDMTLALEHHADRLRVHVSDTSPRTPVLAHRGLEATTGRGLVLVEELAERWGVRHLDRRGKIVWFELGS